MKQCHHLVLDVSFLAWKAFYTTPGLTHDDLPTGVLFGFLRDVKNLEEQFRTDRTVFCFDGPGKGRREKMHSFYKQKRREKYLTMSEEDKLLHRGMREQVLRLRTKVLKALGYRNVLWQKGREGDDVIASVCQDVVDSGLGTVVIVSSDKDLWQCLRPEISVWNTKKIVTANSFTAEWGLSPMQWADVKAIAGCGGDEVPGIVGIGEKTAAKFLGGKLKDTTKAWQKIVDGNRIWRRNLPLVSLPLPGTHTFLLRDDRVTDERWDRVTAGMGMTSLRSRPRGIKPKRRGLIRQ